MNIGTATKIHFGVYRITSEIFPHFLSAICIRWYNSTLHICCWYNHNIIPNIFLNYMKYRGEGSWYNNNKLHTFCQHFLFNIFTFWGHWTQEQTWARNAGFQTHTYRVSQKNLYIKFRFFTETHHHETVKKHFDSIAICLRSWLVYDIILSDTSKKNCCPPGSEKSHYPVGSNFFPKPCREKWPLAIW